MSTLAELRRRLDVLEETVQMLVDFIGEKERLNLKAELDPETGDIIYRRPSGLN